MNKSENIVLENFKALNQRAFALPDSDKFRQAVMSMDKALIREVLDEVFTQELIAEFDRELERIGQSK